MEQITDLCAGGIRDDVGGLVGGDEGMPGVRQSIRLHVRES